jgi:hypothetical protein
LNSDIASLWRFNVYRRFTPSNDRRSRGKRGSRNWRRKRTPCYLFMDTSKFSF